MVGKRGILPLFLLASRKDDYILYPSYGSYEPRDTPQNWYMKFSRIIFSACLALFPLWANAQGVQSETEILDYYRQMAISDAQLEQTLVFQTPEDEADYWKDQLQFEKRLKEIAYSAYKTYIYFKGKVYLAHQEECDIAINHGKGYASQANFYSRQEEAGEPSITPLLGHLNRIVVRSGRH